MLSPSNSLPLPLQQLVVSSSPGLVAHTEASSQLSLYEGVSLLTLREKTTSPNVICPNRGGVCVQGEEAAVLTLVNETEEATFWQIPMEDEYMDRAPQSLDSLSSVLPAQPGSKGTAPFSEPLEVGENDSLSQCFTGTENLVDSDSCVSSGPLSRTDWGCVCCEKNVQQLEVVPGCHWAACAISAEGCTGCKHSPEEDGQPLLGCPKVASLPQCMYGLGPLPTDAAADKVEIGGQATDGADPRLPSSEPTGGHSPDQPPVSGKRVSPM